MDAYVAWVRQNRQLVSSLENIANTITWFLPERFSSSEIGTETVASLLGLITTLNQLIIDSAPQPSRKGTVTESEQNTLLLTASLSAVKQLEVLIEVVAEHYKGRERKWTILAAMEAIKASLRFLIFRRNGYNMLLDGGETIFKESSASRESSFQRNLIDKRQSHQTLFTGNMETKASMAMLKFRENIGINATPSWVYRHQNSKSPIGVKGSTSLESSTDIPSVTKSTFLETWDLPKELSVAGEWVFILRPLFYVLLVRRYGLRSWKPWIASLALDATSIATILTAHILKYQRSIRCNGNRQYPIHVQLHPEEVQEFKRRQLLLLLYLARDPFFSMCTRPSLGAFEKTLKPVPVIGSLGGKMIHFLSDIQTRYCYTSGS